MSDLHDEMSRDVIINKEEHFKERNAIVEDCEKRMKKNNVVD